MPTETAPKGIPRGEHELLNCSNARLIALNRAWDRMQDCTTGEEARQVVVDAINEEKKTWAMLHEWAIS